MHLCVPRPTENISEAQRYTLRITAFYKLLSFFRFCLLCEFTALFFQIKATLYEIIYKHMFQCSHLLFIEVCVDITVHGTLSVLSFIIACWQGKHLQCLWLAKFIKPFNPAAESSTLDFLSANIVLVAIKLAYK